MQEDIEISRKLRDLFIGKARTRAAYGGRGSAKTYTFALMSAIHGYRYGKAGKSGIILCGREYMNSLAESSFEEVKNAITTRPFLDDYYACGEKYIRSKDGRINYSFSGMRRNIDSIKGMSNIILAWLDEAENVSEEAYLKLLPTVRKAGSEVWVTWNPQKKGSPTDTRFRQTKDDNMKIANVNWRDNPWFKDTELVDVREKDRNMLTKAQFEWVWEGAYLENSDESIIKQEYFGRYDKFPSIKESVIIVDTGNKPAEHNDPTAFIFAGIGHDGQIYLIDFFKKRMESNERESSLVDFYNKHRKSTTMPFGASLIKIEDIGTGTDLIQRTRRSGLPVTGITRTGSRSKYTSGNFSAKYNRLMLVIEHIAKGIVNLPSQPIYFGNKQLTDAAWVSDFIEETGQFMPDDSHKHDECVDLLIDTVTHFKKRKVYLSQ